MNMTPIFIMCALMLPLLGGLLAATPWLMRARECFAVTVPTEAQHDSAVVALKKRYTWIMVAATVVCTLLELVFFAVGANTAGIAVLIAGCLGLAVLSFGLMLWGRARVVELKEARGWKAAGDMRSTVVSEGDIPKSVSLGWELLNVPIILLTLAIGCLGYATMPEQIPMHFGIDGQVGNWADKSPWVVLFVPGIQLFMTLCMLMSHWGIGRSKKPNDPASPVASAWAYGMFARAQSIFLVAMGVLLNLGFIGMQLAFVGVITMGAAAAVLCLVAVLAVVGSVALAAVYGQSGARLLERMGDDHKVLQDDDRYWKFGVFYVNRDDPSVFVPARFGIGWTNNLARPLTWVLFGGLVVLTVVLVVFVALVA